MENYKSIFATIAIFLVIQFEVFALSQETTTVSSRRQWLFAQPKRLLKCATALATAELFAPRTCLADDPGPTGRFVTKAQAEYTNSITASRDTNVSPKEAYDSIMRYIPRNQNWGSKKVKALDVGAGAGLSTSYLYDQLGYKDIDAVDWSGDAWRSNVLSTPPSVRFYELDDDTFYSMIKNQRNQQHSNDGEQPEITNEVKYQVICYNFAVNPSKAVRVAKEFLSDDGFLFAPINDRAEYWYKQTYYVLNSEGQILQKSGADVGAWSVQFQPDVTSPTCTGIWCGDINGFNQKRAK